MSPTTGANPPSPNGTPGFTPGCATRFRPHQDRGRVTARQPTEPSGSGFEATENRGREDGRTWKRPRSRVDPRGQALEIVPFTAAVPVRADEQAGQDSAGQAVAHGVEDAEVEASGVEGVVEAIAPDLVGGLEQAGNRHAGCGEGKRRQ